MKIGKLIAVIVSAAACLGIDYADTFAAAAESPALPAPYDNLTFNARTRSFLETTDNGYMRVYVPEEEEDNFIRVEYYDKNFALTDTMAIPRELEYWGGFYAGEEYYFTVEGQRNTDEIDSNEVIRVNQYDKNWNKLGTANITGNSEMFGGEVRYPFDYGSCEMTECNGTLYIATGHQGYVDPAYNQGHQGLLLLMVDEATMTGQVADCDLWHSFAQYIDTDGENLYLFENSEGNGQSQLTMYTPAVLPADYFDSQQMAMILEYGGERTSAWAIATYAECYGISLSGENVLTLGTSIDQEKYGEDTTYNIYLGITPKDNISTEATTVKWLTSLSDDGDGYYSGVDSVALTKINDDRFLISWNQYNDTLSLTDDNDPLSEYTLHYLFVDGEGNELSEEFTADASFSDCHPIYDGERIVFYASGNSALAFYAIDPMSGELEKTVYRAIGENVSWYYEDGVLTVSGTGEMSLPEVDWFSDSAWPSELRNKVTSLVIETGVTNISDSAFAYFDSLETVVIEDGVESIGAEAFYDCDNLEKVIIPASVTSIGEDIVWTGSYWVHDNSHVYQATIYTKKGSVADQYAEKYGISCSYATYITPYDTGDVDGDSMITIQDSFAALLAYARESAGNSSGLTEKQRSAADVDGDGRLTIQDAFKILVYYAQESAGLSPSWD